MSWGNKPTEPVEPETVFEKFQSAAVQPQDPWSSPPHRDAYNYARSEEEPGEEPARLIEVPKEAAAEVEPEVEPEPEPEIEPEVEPESEPDTGGEVLWERHPNDRWIVGDAGRQPDVRPKVAASFKTPPPDLVVDGAEVGSISFRAASVRGIGHQERGEPRQDAYAVRFTQDKRWLVGCIADGVSEGHRSHEAAATIVDKITDVLVTHLTRNAAEEKFLDWPRLAKTKLPWNEAVSEANAAVMAQAKEHLTRVYKRQQNDDKLRELEESYSFAHARSIMSSTALAFIVATAPSADGTYHALLANVAGDSSAFLLQNNAWIPMSDIKNEGKEIFSGSVRSLPNDVSVHVNPFYLQVGDAFVVMTDGLGDPLGAARGTVGAFLRHHWQTPPDPLAFAQHLSFYKKTFTDDRTAVMVWGEPPRKGR
ncbi:MAG: protein phosphatase 2C domain-containing protein [Actinoplanes sp.]